MTAGLRSSAHRPQ